MSEKAPEVSTTSITPAADLGVSGLLDAGGASLREAIQTTDLDRGSREWLALFVTNIDQEAEKIGLIAQKSADAYWSVIKEARASMGKKEQCMIGTRVRFAGLGATLTAEWYRNRFSASKDGGSRIFSEYIRKGQSHRYNMTHFKREPYWARQVIEMVENRYTTLRKRAEILGKIRRHLVEYEQLLETG